ncbi:hypothetical protein K493DRAFT_274842 [Basidiobolus meristosporus CBS 931.73]|uniref:Zinc finger protein 830 n=1 Tax=Basidiobolus meristosporus CBS 931.73 TaxID=1314790 RepID=A0A1Y1Z5W8_9FUNG|nr:hypothetical protein K493DRAFT_274842 [Basidiobolus meristosporus CBS 931.73]|eukprot:ORY05606.1 hypothetical protein K493DRAFT_274842 [Basidiobolus meristosporus CBS 931.73]
MSATNVRKLLSKAKQNRSTTSKIDHPLAKYDSLGRLTCIVCNSTVKSERGWPVHLSSKLHKESLERVKALPKSQAAGISSSKRGLDVGTRIPSSAAPLQTSLEEYDQPSEEESTEDLAEPKQKKLKSDPTPDQESTPEEQAPNGEESSLPADFFDAPPENPEEQSAAVEEEVPKPESGLPAGFFDNAEEEVKVLGSTAPKVKEATLEKEWEIFQREIHQEAQLAEKIVEQEEVETALDREEEERRTQASLLSRVNLLKMKAAENRRIIGEPVVVTHQSEESEELTDDEVYEDLLDWRTRRAI